jgi:hypothetical protein
MELFASRLLWKKGNALRLLGNCYDEGTGFLLKQLINPRRWVWNIDHANSAGPEFVELRLQLMGLSMGDAEGQTPPWRC